MVNSNLLCIFSPTRCLIPLSKIGVKRYYTKSSFTGYNIYYVFGIRVAMIQKTNPWE